VLLLPVIIVGAAALYDASVPDSPEPPDQRFEAEPASILASATTFKIVTYNIQNTWIVGKNRAARMWAIGEKLTALDPDVVAFQEALVDADRAILLNSLRGSRLKYHHYFQSRRLGSGLLVCSAWPIRETWFHRYSESGEWFKFWEGDWWIGKGIALARLELPQGGVLDLYTTHTQAGYDNPHYHQVRKTQMNELAAFMSRTRRDGEVAILAGDMNCRPQHDEFQSLVADARLERLMTIPSGVDHIFMVLDSRYTAATLETRRVEGRIKAGGEWTDLSDHAGFLSMIRVTPGG